MRTETIELGEEYVLTKIEGKFEVLKRGECDSKSIVTSRFARLLARKIFELQEALENQKTVDWEFTEVYSVYTQENEFGRQGAKLGDFSASTDAASFAVGKGWWGGNADVVPQKALKVGEHIFLLQSKKPIDLDGQQKKKDDELREKTLESLSPEQRRVLGL